MSTTVIDEYLTHIEPAKRRKLERIRDIAKQAVPDAEEAIVYRMPTLTYAGKPFLGFDARKNHIGIYPYSAEAIESLADELHAYATSRGAIRVPLDGEIPAALLRKLIALRLKAIRGE